MKALRVDDPIQVTGGKKKQDIIVGDSTGTARLTLWENEIGSIKEDNSYKLNGMTVREYRGIRFLSTSKDNSHILEVDDIGSVQEEEEVPLNTNISTVKNGCTGSRHLQQLVLSATPKSFQMLMTMTFANVLNA